jgi:hypothetical protein
MKRKLGNDLQVDCGACEVAAAPAALRSSTFGSNSRGASLRKVRWHEGEYLISDDSSLVRGLDALFLDIVHV